MPSVDVVAPGVACDPDPKVFGAPGRWSGTATFLVDDFAATGGKPQQGTKMLDYKRCSSPNGARTRRIALCMQLIVALLYAPTVFSADVAVTVTTARAAGQTNNFSGSLRWTLEEDVTWPTDPANPPANLYDSPTLKLHKSYMPVARTGSSASPSFTITGLDASKRYYLSILPDRPADSISHARCARILQIHRT